MPSLLKGWIDRVFTRELLTLPIIKEVLFGTT